jgi:plastocyanin
LKRVLVITIAAGALAVPATASAATTIGVGDNFFDPKTAPAVDLGPASSFSWTWGPPTSLNEHNVVSNQDLFDSGKVATSGSFAVSASAGTFAYHCVVHELEGMNGTVAVKPTAESITKKSFKVIWASATSDTGNKFDVKYSVDGKKTKTWLSDTNKTSAKFGKKKKPVKVKPGHDYTITVRSKKGSSAQHTSGFSPPLIVGT